MPSKSFRRALAIAALAAHGLTTAPSRADTIPPTGYQFDTPDFCREGINAAIKPRPGQAAYDVCADQMALFARGLAEAKSANKLLLVTFGATWCSWCAALQKAMPTPELLGHRSASLDFGRTFHPIEIGLSTAAKSGQVEVPSGHAVLRHVLARAGGAKLRALPFVAVIDPNRMEHVAARNIDDIAVRDGAFDFARLRTILIDAEAYVRGAGAAPVEPGWLRRKWQRWWNG